MQKPFFFLRIFLVFLFIEVVPASISAQVLPHYYTNWKPTKKQIKGYTYQRKDQGKWYIFRSGNYKYKENGDPDTFTYISYYDKMFPNFEDSFIERKSYKFRKGFYPYHFYYYYYWYFKNKPEWIAEETFWYYEQRKQKKKAYKEIALFNEDSLVAGYISYKLLPNQELSSRSTYYFDANKNQNGWNHEKWNGNAWGINVHQRTDTFFNPSNGSTEIIYLQNNIAQGYFSSYKTICYFDKDRKITNLARYYMNSGNNFWIPTDSFSNINWHFYDQKVLYNFYSYGTSLFYWANSYQAFYWDRSDNGGWRPGGIFYKELNKDTILSAEYKSYINRTGNKDSARTLYSYYPDGYHKQTLQQQWKDGRWHTTRSLNTRNTYDADGDIVYSSETDEDAFSSYISEKYRIYYHYTEGITYRRKTPNHEYKVYPNPTMDEVNISVPDADSVSFKIGVYNTLGQQLMHVNQNVRDFKINLRNYPAGMYFLVFDSRSGRKTVKIIKAEAKTY